MAIRPNQEATSRQLWRLNREGKLLLVPEAEPITVAQADTALGGSMGDVSRRYEKRTSTD